MPTGTGDVRYCRQCRKDMPLEDFINRAGNGYCIVCKTCRDKQLKRYYGRLLEGKQANMKKRRMNHIDIPMTITTVKHRKLQTISCRLKHKRKEYLI